MGNTTAKAFAGLKVQGDRIDVAHAYKTVLNQNKASESNGSLMRCTPMAVYTHLIGWEKAHQICSADVMFTHCAKNVIDAVFLYGQAIGYLIRHADHPNRAQEALEWCLNFSDKISNDVFDWIKLS